MAQSNPMLIQPAPPGFRRPPLVLIHDGGGSVFNYFLLKSLGRAVYGIYNPRTGDGEQWPGGITEMAREYCQMILRAVPEGEILIGGWSLGGMVALEAAHILAIMPRCPVRVRGVVMIDTDFPHGLSTGEKKSAETRVANSKAAMGQHVKPEIRQAVERSMAQAAKLIDEWQPPIWTAPIVPPRTVLIRGREKMDENDVYREKRALGWEDYESDIMAAVLDVDGTHYSMWEKQHISTVDLQLHRGCTLLEHSPIY